MLIKILPFLLTGTELQAKVKLFEERVMTVAQENKKMLDEKEEEIRQLHE